MNKEVTLLDLRGLEANVAQKISAVRAYGLKNAEYHLQHVQMEMRDGLTQDDINVLYKDSRIQKVVSLAEGLFRFDVLTRNERENNAELTEAEADHVAQYLVWDLWNTRYSR